MNGAAHLKQPGQSNGATFPSGLRSAPSLCLIRREVRASQGPLPTHQSSWGHLPVAKTPSGLCLLPTCSCSRIGSHLPKAGPGAGGPRTLEPLLLRVTPESTSCHAVPAQLSVDKYLSCAYSIQAFEGAGWHCHWLGRAFRTHAAELCALGTPQQHLRGLEVAQHL